MGKKNASSYERATTRRTILQKLEIATLDQTTDAINILASFFPQQESGLAVLDEGKPKSLPLTAMEQNARVKLILSSYYLEADVCLKSDELDLFSQMPAISVFSHVIFHFVLPKGMPDTAQDPDCRCALYHFIAAIAWLVCQCGLRV